MHRVPCGISYSGLVSGTRCITHEAVGTPGVSSPSRRSGAVGGDEERSHQPPHSRLHTTNAPPPGANANRNVRGSAPTAYRSVWCT